MESIVSIFIGMGWDSYDQSRWFYYATHNAFLKIFFELGMVGLILFFALMIKPIQIVASQVNRASNSDRGLLVAFSVGQLSLTIYFLFSNLTSVLLYMWAYAGLMLKLAYLVERAKRK